jgi:hypothetical protein
LTSTKVSIQLAAKLRRRVNARKIASTRARTSSALSVDIGEIARLRLFQTGSIGWRCGDAMGRNTSVIPSSAARVRAYGEDVRGEVVQDEQNPPRRILLADRLEDFNDPLFVQALE